VLVHAPGDPTRTPHNFILLDWCATRIVQIRDFHHARYVLESAELTLNQSGGL
jgi:RNA polymerase sigma-70 factor (ECF subfamily)